MMLTYQHLVYVEHPRCEYVYEADSVGDLGSPSVEIIPKAFQFNFQITRKSRQSRSTSKQIGKIEEKFHKNSVQIFKSVRIKRK